MRAWWVQTPGPISRRPLVSGERPVPTASRDEVRVRVLCCGVCRTDLHLAEGDLPPRRPAVVPGHEIVGTVDAVGADVTQLRTGDLVGIAWLRRTCGACDYCRRGSENLCVAPAFTGWDADGGYAEYAVAPAGYVYRLPHGADPERTAPLLCAGIIGYRALKVAGVAPGKAVGIYGLGASGHLAAQVALHWGCRVHVLTRSAAAQRLALDLGAASAGAAADAPPEPLDAAVLFAPVGDLVPPALAALAPGGTLAVAGIHLTDIPPLNYDRHLFRERALRSVTANTRADGDEFLRLAAGLDLQVSTTAYPFERAAGALADLAADRVTGAAVIDVAD